MARGTVAQQVTSNPWAPVSSGGSERPSSQTVTTTDPTSSTSNQTSSGTTSGSRITNTTSMDPASLAALQNLILQLQGQGTQEIAAERARRLQLQQLTEGMLTSLTPQQAMADATNLMALNLQQSMEQNMPAISKAIEGSGTSASSMQGLLSQKAARDASLAAGALGAQQQQVYAHERGNILNTLEALTRPMGMQTQMLLRALESIKGAQTTSTENFSQNTTGSQTTNERRSGTSQTETYQPILDNASVTPGSITSTSGAGMDWMQAMAAARDSQGNIDWVKAAGLL